MIPPSSSLVKYETPVLVIKKEVEDDKPATTRPRTAVSISSNASVSNKSREQTEEILDAVLPPREWEEEDQKWTQHVSSTPATRMDVLNLEEQLDSKLQQRQARETGICPVRRELYDQCFDELIRQVTISCAERGLLLLRVRDELRMTLSAHQTLYESAIAFGIRKALQAEHGVLQAQAQVEELKGEKAELLSQVTSLRAECQQTERLERQRQELLIARHQEEVQGLNNTNQNLKAQLEAIIAVRNR